LIAAIVVGRILGRDDYGALGVIQNTIGMFGTLAGFGMGLTANKHVAEFKETNPEKTGRIIGISSLLAWISSGIMGVTLFCAARTLATHTLAAPELGGILQLGALLLFLNGLNGAQTGVLSGFENFKTIAHINLISGLCAFPLMLGGAYYWGLHGVIWSLIAVALINCLLCYCAIRAESERFKIRISFNSTASDRKLFLNFSVPAVLTGLLNGIVAWLASVLIVNQADGYSDMGIYNAALRVKLLPEMFLGMLIAPMLPILAESLGKNDTHTFERTLKFNFTLAVLIIVPISLIEMAAPELTLLPFGPDYQGRTGTVQWLMLHSVIYALIFPMGSILISMGEMWFSWFVNLLYATLFGLTAWWLVPSYGSSGYAAAMVAAYFIANIPCVFFLYRRIPNVMHFLSWRRLAIVVVLLLGCCFLASEALPFPLAIAAGCCAAAASIALTYRLNRPIPTRATIQ
jgi:O-antigen/teichoic acid export membrane protein